MNISDQFVAYFFETFLSETYGFIYIYICNGCAACRIQGKQTNRNLTCVSWRSVKSTVPLNHCQRLTNALLQWFSICSMCVSGVLGVPWVVSRDSGSVFLPALVAVNKVKRAKTLPSCLWGRTLKTEVEVIKQLSYRVRCLSVEELTLDSQQSPSSRGLNWDVAH